MQQRSPSSRLFAFAARAACAVIVAAGAFCAPPQMAVAAWNGTPETCHLTTELEKNTAAYVTECGEPVEHRPLYIPRLKLPEGKLLTAIRAACGDEAAWYSQRDPEARHNLRERCIADMALEALARTECNAPNSSDGLSVWGAPQFTDAELRDCVSNAKERILLREEPDVRSKCSVESGDDLKNCVDTTFLFGPQGKTWADTKAELRRTLAGLPRYLGPRSDLSKKPQEAGLPKGPCGPGQGLKPDPSAFGAWTCQQLGAFLPPPRPVESGDPKQSPQGQSKQSSARAPAAGVEPPATPSVKSPQPKVPQAKAPQADTHSAPIIQIRIPNLLTPMAPALAAPQAPATTTPTQAAPKTSTPKTPAPRTPPAKTQEPPRIATPSVTKPKAPLANVPTITGGRQDIRSFDAKQGTIVTADGRKVSIRPMIKTLERVSPVAAKQPFVATPSGTLRLSPTVQRVLAERANELKTVGGVELDVTFKNLAIAGVPEMTATGPRTVVENPVMISLQRLIAAARPYAQPQERWNTLPDDIRYPGGIGRVHGYVLDPATKDVFVVGTRAVTREGRLDIDLLTVLMDVVWSKGLTPGVSLDPAPEGGRLPSTTSPLAQAPDVPRPPPVELTPSSRIDAAWDFAGPQFSRIINLPADSLIARILLDADYEMKRINFGLVKPLASGFLSQAEILKEEMDARGLFSARFWFHPIPLSPSTVRVASSGRVVLYDAGVQLLTETITESGIGTAEVHPSAVRAAEEFTRAFPRMVASNSVRSTSVLALLQGANDVVTFAKLLRDAAVDYPVLDDFRRLPYRRLSGVELAPSTYPGLTVGHEGTGGRGFLMSGGVNLQSRTTRRSFDPFEDEVVASFETIASGAGTDGFVRPVPITFTLASQQFAIDPAAEIAKQAGQRLLSGGQPAQASKRLRESVDKSPLDIDAWILLAMAEARAGQPAAARAALQQAQAIDVSDLSVQRAAIHVALLTKQPPAFDAIDPIVRRDVSNEYAELAFSAARRGNHGLALEAAETAIRAWPESHLGYMARGLIHALRDQDDLAIKEFSEVIRLSPDTAVVYVHRGYAYGAKGQYALAINDLDRAVQLDPNNARAFKFRADAYTDSNDRARAMADYDRSIAINPRYVRALFARGELHSVQEQYDRAIADFSEAIKIDPEHKFSIVRRGAMYASKLEYARAIADFDAAIRLDANDPVARVWRAVSHLDSGEPEKAIRDFDEAIRLGATVFPVYYGRAVAHGRMGNVDKQIPDYSEAIKLRPDHSLTFVLRGDVYRRQGNYDRAVQDYDAAIKLQPKSALAYVNRGAAYSDRGMLDRALADFEKAITLDPRDALALNNRGVLYNKRGEQARAIDDFSAAIRLNPSLAIAYSGRGDALRRAGQFDRALTDFTEALRLDPKYALAFYGRGLVQIDRKEYDRAIADLGESIRINPGFAPAFLYRGQGYSSKRDSKVAIADFDEAIRLNPRYTLAFFARGNEYSYIKDYDRSINDWSEAIRLDPKFAPAWVRRADAYVLKREYDRALPDLSEAIRLDPNLEFAYFSRALIHANRRDFEQAIADYTEALRLRPGHVSYLHGRGRAHLSRKDHGRAIADLSQALAGDPRDAESYRNRAIAYADSGDLDSALADVSQAISIDPRNGLSFYLRASLFALRNEFDRAISDFSEDIKLRPTPMSLHRRGKLYASRKDYERAVADYSEALRLEPGSLPVLFDRAVANYFRRDYDRAIVDLSEIIRIDPKSGSAYRARAEAWRGKGDMTRANADFDEAIRINPSLR